MGSEWAWEHVLEGQEIYHVLSQPVFPGLSLLSYNYTSPSCVSLGEVR